MTDNGRRREVPPGLAPGHAFDAFDMRAVTVAGADWAMEMDVTPRVSTDRVCCRVGCWPR